MNRNLKNEGGEIKELRIVKAMWCLAIACCSSGQNKELRDIHLKRECST